MNNLLSYDEWLEEHQSDINIELAETGADRELDFNLEIELEKRYDIYVDNNMRFLNN
jgi:hypothetical protein